MTTPNLRFDAADYDSVKANLVEFMSAQDEWKDYNFRASGLDAILSVLAYQLHYALFYGSMTASESTLDSATLRSSIVSIARDLSYTPRSVSAASAEIDLVATPSGNDPLPSVMTIPKGTLFDARASILGDGQDAVTFVVKDSVTADVVGAVRSFKGVQLVQGTYRVIEFVMDKRDESQRFVLPNARIDTDHLEVYVQENNDDSRTSRWTRASSSFDSRSDSTVYYLYEVEDGRFAVGFGDGILGRDVEHGKLIRVVYLETTGENGNEYDSFTLVRRSDSAVTQELLGAIVETTTKKTSTGGRPPESKQSIKNRASRRFASRLRAVNADDWKEYVLERYSNDVKSVTAWGHGGKVIVSCNPAVGRSLTERRRLEIEKELRETAAVYDVKVDVVEADRVYVRLKIAVKTTGTGSVDDQSSDVATTVRETVKRHDEQRLGDFGGGLVHSKLSRAVDDCHSAIAGTQIWPTLEVRNRVTIGKKTSMLVDFKNPIVPGSVRSVPFQWENRQCRLESTPSGVVNLVRESDGSLEAIGSADHQTGVVMVSPLVIQSSPSSSISFTATPVDLDVVAPPGTVLSVNQAAVSVFVDGVKR